MPETIGNATPVSQTAPKKRNERTEAKLLEDANKIIAEAERLGADYDPPNDIAKLANLKARRDDTLAGRAANQANEAAEETTRNDRENLFKPLNRDVTSLVAYAKSAGKELNAVAALASIARDVKGGRAKAVDKNDGKQHISVSNMSYASRTDNYAQFIEQYDTLNIKTNEDFFKTATHRAKLSAQRDATNAVIQAESNTNTTGAALDNLAYLDNDSLLNACISAKNYLKSKYGTKGQPYLNIAKTRLELPTRLRRKK